MRKPIYTFLLLVCTIATLAAQGDFQKGLSYYKQGQYAKAIEEFEQIVKASPDYEDGYRILGDSYLKTRQYAKAVSSFQNALRLDGDNFVSYHGLAIAYFNTGRYRDTAATLLKAERFARSPAERHKLYQMRGSAYFNLKEFNEAVADLQKANSLQRGQAAELLQLGIAYYHLGNHSEAEKYLNQTLARDAGNVEARRYLSRMDYLQATQAIEQGRYSQAAALLRNHVDQNPGDGEAWFNLGLAQLFANNLKSAEEAFLKSSQLMPQNWESFERLGYIYEKTKRYNLSLDAYKKAHALSQNARVKQSVDRIQERLRRSAES
ncbi:MAG: tetratricopeptide repeat protein [Acidobacteriota bacterium]